MRFEVVIGKKEGAMGTGEARCKSIVCPRSRDPFYVVIYYKKWVNTSWTLSNK